MPTQSAISATYKFLLLLAALAPAAGAAPAAAAEAIRLTLTSGREFVGEVSPRTDLDRLWLVQRVGSAQLTRPIAWSNVVAAEFRGAAFTSAALRDLLVTPAPVVAASARAQPDANEAQQNPFADDPSKVEELPIPTDASTPVKALTRAEFLALTTAPVASVRLDAHIANWDADVEADGLVVQVVPVDRHGQVVPVRGTLVVELFGVRRIPFQDAPSKRGRSYERLGRWSQLLTAEYFHSDGGWFKLPFQAAHPEFDPRIGLNGLVNVKLIVPGSGVFEDSLDSVRLRPYAPLRDALERDTGHRFFPTELTGLGKRSW